MSRVNLKITTGSYAGTGVAQTITAVDHPSELLIIKGGANIACFRTKEMRGDSTAFLAGNTANFTGGITGLTSNGFVLGTDAKVNANGTTYHWISIWGAAGQDVFRTFSYIGNAGDARQLTASGINFTPNIAWTKGDTAQNPAVRSNDVTGDNSWHFSGTADTSNEIQNFVTNGIELGTSSRVNGNGLEYFGVALKHVPGIINSFTFTGDGKDDRGISGFGFQPGVVFAKNATLTTAAVMRTDTFSGDSSTSVGASSPTTDIIQSLDSDGIHVGTTTSVNAAGNVIWGFALKTGNFNVPLNRTTA